VKAESMPNFLKWKSPDQKYIIANGLLAPETKLILFGKWFTWKSMIAMHTAITLAAGKPWFGFHTVPVTTYLLQIELPKPKYQERVAKYSIGNNLNQPNCFFRSEPYIKLDRDYGLNDLIREMEEIHPQVLIIDPVYKVISGHLTDEHDIREFTDRMDILIAKYKLGLILIHHDRKERLIDGQLYQSAEDMFGSSIFLDWCDTSIRTANTGKDGEIKITFEKVRYAEQEMKPILVQVDRSKLTFSMVTSNIVTTEEISFR